MYLSHKERHARWREDVARVERASCTSDAHFLRVARWWPTLSADAHLMAMQARHGVRGLGFERTLRCGKSATREGVSVLELVVLSGVVAAFLRHSDVVRWLATHHAEALGDLQAAADAALP